MKSVDPSITDAIRTINQLRNVRYVSAVHLVLCLNVVKKNIPAVLAGDPCLIEEEGDRSLTTVFYTFIANEESEPDFLNRLHLLYENAAFDITDPAHIRRFFIEHVLYGNEAARYMLFTWDHGNGYGIFKERTDTINGVIVKKKVMEVVSNKDEGRDDKVLTMDELACSLRVAFGSTKIEVMVMLNCYMLSADSCYALREQVRYFVAPQTAMHFDGYNYVFFFRRLCAHPGLSAEELAKTMVSSFEVKFYDDITEGAAAKAMAALFAVDLARFELLANAIDRYTDAIAPFFERDLPELVMARASMAYVNRSTWLVDLFQWLNNWTILQLPAGGADWGQYMERIRKKLIVQQHVGQDFLRVPDSPRPHGISVFFPIRYKGAIGSGTGLDAFDNSSYTQERKWNSFVKRFAEGVQPPE